MEAWSGRDLFSITKTEVVQAHWTILRQCSLSALLLFSAFSQRGSRTLMPREMRRHPASLLHAATADSWTKDERRRRRNSQLLLLVAVLMLQLDSNIEVVLRLQERQEDCGDQGSSAIDCRRKAWAMWQRSSPVATRGPALSTDIETEIERGSILIADKEKDEVLLIGSLMR